LEQISSKGQIKISGSKNASLPILAATLLSNKKVYLKIYQS
jgi:UDP-N-acetylglucosamine 1-carboxyvinyltransferase